MLETLVKFYAPAGADRERAVEKAVARAAGRVYRALEKTRWDNGKMRREYGKRTLSEALRDGTVHYPCACFDHSAAILAELEREMPGCGPELVCKFGKVTGSTKAHGHGWAEFSAEGKRWSLDPIWWNMLHLSPRPVPRGPDSLHVEIPLDALDPDATPVGRLAGSGAERIAEEYFRERIWKLEEKNTAANWDLYRARAGGDPRIPKIA